MDIKIEHVARHSLGRITQDIISEHLRIKCGPSIWHLLTCSNHSEGEREMGGAECVGGIKPSHLLTLLKKGYHCAVIRSKQWNKQIPNTSTKHMCTQYTTTSQWLFTQDSLESGFTDPIVLGSLSCVDLLQPLWNLPLCLPAELFQPEMTCSQLCTHQDKSWQLLWH